MGSPAAVDIMYSTEICPFSATLHLHEKVKKHKVRTFLKYLLPLEQEEPLMESGKAATVWKWDGCKRW